MCIGLFALFSVIQVPDQMNMGIMVILGAGLLHLFFVSVIGRLPRIMGALLTIAYGVFLYTGSWDSHHHTKFGEPATRKKQQVSEILFSMWAVRDMYNMNKN
jgi:Ca2+/Na+ antiporter